MNALAKKIKILINKTRNRNKMFLSLLILDGCEETSHIMRKASLHTDWRPHFTEFKKRKSTRKLMVLTPSSLLLPRTKLVCLWGYPLNKVNTCFGHGWSSVLGSVGSWATSAMICVSSLRRRKTKEFQTLVEGIFKRYTRGLHSLQILVQSDQMVNKYCLKVKPLSLW